MAGGGRLGAGQGLPRPLFLDQLGRGRAAGGFHQRVVQGVPRAAPIEAPIPASMRWAVTAKDVGRGPAPGGCTRPGPAAVPVPPPPRPSEGASGTAWARLWVAALPP